MQALARTPRFLEHERHLVSARRPSAPATRSSRAPAFIPRSAGQRQPCRSCTGQAGSLQTPWRRPCAAVAPAGCSRRPLVHLGPMDVPRARAPQARAPPGMGSPCPDLSSSPVPPLRRAAPKQAPSAPWLPLLFAGLLFSPLLLLLDRVQKAFGL